MFIELQFEQIKELHAKRDDLASRGAISYDARAINILLLAEQKPAIQMSVTTFEPSLSARVD